MAILCDTKIVEDRIPAGEVFNVVLIEFVNNDNNNVGSVYVQQEDNYLGTLCLDFSMVSRFHNDLPRV